MKRITSLVFALLLTLCAFMCMACGKEKAAEEEPPIMAFQEKVTNTFVLSDNEEDFKDNEDVGGELVVTMLDVGQGECILFESEGQTLLYDGGGRDSSSYVVSYLQSKGLESLDYVVASHYDDDHLSGLVGVLKVFAVSNVLCPDYEADTQIYSSFVQALNESNATVTKPLKGKTFEFGSAVVTVMAPADYTADNENDRSIALRIETKGFSCIVTGDAEAAEESDMLNSGIPLDCDLYIAGHHGSSNSSSAAFAEAMDPSHVMISVGKENEYGHPADEVVERFKMLGANIYRTDENGNVKLTAEGNKVSVITEYVEPKSDVSEEDAVYVLNTGTYKFHLPDCESVAKMSGANKKYTDKTREELIKEGYDPCGYCQP